MPGSRWLERPHRVEEVCDGAHAEVERLVRLACVRVRVSAGHRHPTPVQHGDEAVGSGELGSERDEPHGPRVEQALEQREIGIAASRLGMRTSRFAARNGPSRCAPSTRGRCESCGSSGERRDELVLGRGDERREKRRHTRLEQRLPGDAIARRIRIEEVDPGEAVHLQVDEPG